MQNNSFKQFGSHLKVIYRYGHLILHHNTKSILVYKFQRVRNVQLSSYFCHLSMDLSEGGLLNVRLAFELCIDLWQLETCYEICRWLPRTMTCVCVCVLVLVFRRNEFCWHYGGRPKRRYNNEKYTQFPGTQLNQTFVVTSYPVVQIAL